jgi:hypothetical protein
LEQDEPFEIIYVEKDSAFPIAADRGPKLVKSAAHRSRQWHSDRPTKFERHQITPYFATVSTIEIKQQSRTGCRPDSVTKK